MELRKASKEEIPQIFANVHEAWPHDGDLNTHINLRLNSPQHQRANWYVAKDGDTVAASLGAYPYNFWLGSEKVKGIAIGAVHTIKAYRRQGWAEKLIQHVHDTERSNGSKISLLFSDIDPNYYKKTGYEIIPYSHGCLEAKQNQDVLWEELTESDYPFEAKEGDIAQIHRSPDHWLWLRRRHKSLRYLRCSYGTEAFGYVICGTYEGKFYALDYVKIISGLGIKLQSCAHFCQQPEIHFWASNSREDVSKFEPKSEIPMVKSLDETYQVPRDWIFQAIDHV